MIFNSPPMRTPVLIISSSVRTQTNIPQMYICELYLSITILFCLINGKVTNWTMGSVFLPTRHKLNDDTACLLPAHYTKYVNICLQSKLIKWGVRLCWSSTTLIKFRTYTYTQNTICPSNIE